MLAYSTDCGALLVSGGSMANFVGFRAARRAKAPWPVRVAGAVDAKRGGCESTPLPRPTSGCRKRPIFFGLGTDSIRWISTDEQFRMDPVALQKCIEEDLRCGDLPFLVVGTAGSVSTGAVDPLPELSTLCKEYGLWFHVEAAYRGFAAVLPEASADLRGLIEADSVAAGYFAQSAVTTFRHIE
jgi:aromatic-L-amino-acid/L-tryptophan decarboxylase